MRSSSGRASLNGRIGSSGRITSENVTRPTESCGAIWSKNTSRPSLARASRFSSFIEPDVSSTSRMSAGLRSSRQDSLIAASTRGSGRPSTRSGSSGSAPFSSLTGATGGVSRSAGRKPAAAATCGVIRSARKRWNAPAPSACSGVTHGASSTMNGLSEKNVPSSG